MAGRDELLELLRPPAHRGPLIAAGAVVLTAGIALEEARLDDELPTFVHVLVLGLAAALVLGLGLLASRDGGAPSPPQSVLLVAGLLLLAGALLRLADLLGGDGGLAAGTLVWTSVVLAVVAAYASVRCDTAICTMIAGLAAGVTVLAGANWLLGAASQTTYRWLLLALAVGFALASLVLRGARPRHAELMVVTGGLATLAIFVLGALRALIGVFGPVFAEGILPGFWELVLLVAGCGLIAYGAVDRVPGAAWLGVANLAAFIVAASAGADDTLLWWPMLLLLLGGGALAAGLRPRTPLPPEPAGYAVERPLASRTGDRDEVAVRVRNDDPPSR